MAQNTKIEETNNFAGDSENGSLDVVNIAEYKSSEESVSPEEASFRLVMSQMNIADRSTFDKQYAKLWQEASEESTLLSVFICEIDLFKAYHDNYGAQGASFMLLVIGLALKKTCEQHGCFLAHYQKEEFAILMKGGDQQKVLEVAENLRLAVETSRTEHKFSSVSRVVTLSIGVSSIYPNSMRVLMNKADNALNKAKVSGRNQVSTTFPQEIISPTNGTELPVHVDKQPTVLLDNNDESHFEQFLLDMDIADRSAFNNNSIKLWQESKAEKELLSMLICEVDFLHPYIEHCGKLASEDILLITACALQQTCEKFGGFAYYMEEDKYIVLLKGGNATNALRFAECVHTFLDESDTTNAYSEVSDVVTVSIGLSSIFPRESNSLQVLSGEASRALNVAIKSGRNQTSVH